MFDREKYIPDGDLKILQTTLRHLISRIEFLEEDHYHSKRMLGMLLDNMNRRLSKVEL